MSWGHCETLGATLQTLAGAFQRAARTCCTSATSRAAALYAPACGSLSPAYSGRLTRDGISQTISRMSFDNMIFPTAGSRFSLSTRATAGALGIGTTDFGKVGFNFDMVNPLLTIGGNTRLVLFLGSELGYVSGFRADTTIPPGELFYMGGNGLGGFAVTPLRGYRDNSFAPVAADGRRLPPGGRMQTRFVTELRFALTLNPFPIYLLSFAEAGNVWEDLRAEQKGLLPVKIKRKRRVTFLEWYDDWLQQAVSQLAKSSQRKGRTKR
ncbi:MAG: BamA/TamA family outer membrane protein [Betaproteobacteria bacterium]